MKLYVVLFIFISVKRQNIYFNFEFLTIIMNYEKQSFYRKTLWKQIAISSAYCKTKNNIKQLL